MKRVKEFLKLYWDKKSPLLLGYSGGPDSKALLYALLEAGCAHLHIAHVDHGWREESLREAEMIAQEMEALKLPFFSTRLKEVPSHNKEEIARDARFSFFQTLFEKNPYQALLLGHQADDLAETILKRILEGSHLPFLGGMEMISQRKEIPVWRPLLKIPKKEILTFLKKKGLDPILDPSNQDITYLRSRMREETLPFLDKSFGKGTRENLCILSERASELKHYLDKKISSARVQRGEEVLITFEQLERIERRHLLQKIAKEEKIFLTRVLMEQILDWIDDSKRRKVFIDSKWIISGRGQVLIINGLDKIKTI